MKSQVKYVWMKAVSVHVGVEGKYRVLSYVFIPFLKMLQ